VDNILKGFEQVPANYQILMELTCLLQDGDVDFSRVQSLISMDAGLAAAVIRLSNGAYFGCAEPATTLDDAIGRIGFSEILKLVGLVSSRLFENLPLTCYGETEDDMMQKSLASAIFMEFLSYDVNIVSGRAYLIGLLHAIGQYPIARIMHRLKPYAFKAEGIDFSAQAKWERGEVGVDYAKVGSELLKNWGFSSDVYRPIQSQLMPLLISGDKREACMLHITCRILPCLLYPNQFSFSDIRIPEAILRTAGLTSEMVEGYIGPSISWMQTTTKLVQMEVSA
jgi:HD-like signal output (HDOD) protein